MSLNIALHPVVSGWWSMTRSTRSSEAAEVVRLDVHERDAFEALEVRRRDGLDLDVEQVRHPQVLGPGDALQRAEDGGGLRAPQQVAQREAAGHRVGIGIVVQENQDLVGVG